MNISRKSVSMREVSPTDPAVEKIVISDQLAEILRKDPVCGRSDYTDLNESSSNHGSTWRSFSEFPRRSDNSSLSRIRSRNSSEEYKKKSEESRRRQKLKREKIIRQREEKRAIQRARLRERHRQREIFDQLQQHCQSPKEGVIISISPQKISPAKKKNKYDRDSYLYDRFKLKTLQQENGLSTLSQKEKNEEIKSSINIMSNGQSPQNSETGEQVLSNIEKIIDTVVSSSSPLSSLEDLLDSEASTNVEDSDDETELESLNGESSDSNDSALKLSLTKTPKEKSHYKTRGSWSTMTSASPEADPDSPTPAVTRRSTRQGKRVNYTEIYDDIEECFESADEECNTSLQKGSKHKSSEKSSKNVSGKRKNTDSTLDNELNVNIPKADEAKKVKMDNDQDPQMKSNSEYLGLSNLFSPSPLMMSTPLTNSFPMHSDLTIGQHPSFTSSQQRLPSNPLLSPSSSHRLNYENPSLFISSAPHCVHPQLPTSHTPPYISQRGFDSPGSYFHSPPHLYQNLVPPPPLFLPTPLPHWSHNGVTKDSNILGNVKPHPGPANSTTQAQLCASSPSVDPMVKDIPKTEILPPNFLLDLHQPPGCGKPDQTVKTVSKVPVRERSLDLPKDSHKNHNMHTLGFDKQANDDSFRGLDSRKPGPNQFVVNLNDSCDVSSASRHVKIDLNNVPVSKHQNFLLMPPPLERNDDLVNSQHPSQRTENNKTITKVSSKLDSQRAVEEMLQQTLLQEAGARSRLFEEKEANKDKYYSEKRQHSVTSSRQTTNSGDNLQSPSARQSDTHITGLQPWSKNLASYKPCLPGELEYNMLSSSQPVGPPPLLSNHYSMNNHLSPGRNHPSGSPTLYSQTFNQQNMSSYQPLMGSPLTTSTGISVQPLPSVYQTTAGHLFSHELQPQPLNDRRSGSFEMSITTSKPHASLSHPHYHQSAMPLIEAMEFSSSVRTPPTPHYPSVQTRNNPLYPTHEFSPYSQSEQLSTAGRLSTTQMQSYLTKQQPSLSERLNPTGKVNYSSVSPAGVCTNPYSSNVPNYSVPNLTDALSKFTSEPRVSGIYRDHTMLQSSHASMHIARSRGPSPHKNFSFPSPSQTFGSLHSASAVKPHNHQEQRFPFGNQGQFSLELSNISASHNQNISHNSSTNRFSRPEFYNQMARGGSQHSQPLKPSRPNSNNNASGAFNQTYSGPNFALNSSHGHRPHNITDTVHHHSNHQSSASNNQRELTGPSQKPSNNQSPNRYPALSLPTTNAQVYHQMHSFQSSPNPTVTSNNARHLERHSHSPTRDVKPVFGSLLRALDLSHKEQSLALTEPNYGPPNQSIFSPPTLRPSVSHVQVSSNSKQAPPPQKAVQKPNLPPSTYHREDTVSHRDRMQSPPSGNERVYASQSNHFTYRPMTVETHVKPRDVKPVLSSLVSALDLGSNVPQKGVAKQMGIEPPMVKGTSNHSENPLKSNVASPHQFYDHPLTPAQIKQEHYHPTDNTLSEALSNPLNQPSNPKPAPLNREKSANTRLTRTLSADGEIQLDARMEVNWWPTTSTTCTKSSDGDPSSNSSSLGSEASVDLVRLKKWVNSPYEEQQTCASSDLSTTSVVLNSALKTAYDANSTQTNHKEFPLSSTITPHISNNAETSNMLNEYLRTNACPENNNDSNVIKNVYSEEKTIPVSLSPSQQSVHVRGSNESPVKHIIHSQEKDSEHFKEKQLGDTGVSSTNQISDQLLLAHAQTALSDQHNVMLPSDECRHSHFCDMKTAASRLEAPQNANPDSSASKQISEEPGTLPLVILTGKTKCSDQKKDSSSTPLISHENEGCLDVDTLVNINAPSAKHVAVVLPPPGYTQLKKLNPSIASPERDKMVFVLHTSGPGHTESISPNYARTAMTSEIGQAGSGDDLDLGLEVENPYIVTISTQALVSSGPNLEHGNPEPDLSLVKEESGGTLVPLNLKEIIDLSEDRDDCVVEVERQVSNTPEVTHSNIHSQNPQKGTVDVVNGPALGDSLKNKEALTVLSVDTDLCENPDPSSQQEFPNRSPKSFTETIGMLQPQTASKALSVPMIKSPLTGQTVMLNSQQIDYIKSLEAKMKEDINRIIAGPTKRPQNNDYTISHASHTKESFTTRGVASQQKVQPDVSQPSLSTSQSSSNSHSISAAVNPSSQGNLSSVCLQQNNQNQVKNLNRMNVKEEPDDSLEGDNDDAASTCSSEISHSSYVSGVSSSKTRRSSSSSITPMKDQQVEPLGTRAQQAISLIGSWTKEEVSIWLKAHHFDKVCPNLSCLDSKGLQRMAFEYHHDPDLFYNRIKKSLGLKLFQTMVICNGMKELCKSSDKSE